MNLIPQEIVKESIVASEKIMSRRESQNIPQRNNILYSTSYFTNNIDNNVRQTIYLNDPPNDINNIQSNSIQTSELGYLSKIFHDPNQVALEQTIVETFEAPPTVVKSLKFPDMNRVCFFCKKVVDDICIEISEKDRICSNCLINILIFQINKFPESELKILNGRAVFSIQGRDSMLTLSFAECYAKLPAQKREEYRKRIKNKIDTLIKDVNEKCMLCNTLLNKKDRNVMELEVDGEYNENQYVFPNINYCNNNHFVCEKCYRPWMRLTHSYQLQDIAILRCEICNIDHSCRYKSKDQCIIF